MFNGNGVVIAPEQKGDRALWDAITVALVAPSSESNDALNNVIEHTTAAMHEAGQNFETLAACFYTCTARLRWAMVSSADSVSLGR